MPQSISASPHSTGATPLPHPPPLQADFMLLCPGGGCKAVEEFDSCSIAKSPSRAGGALAPATRNAFCISAHWAAAVPLWHNFGFPAVQAVHAAAHRNHACLPSPTRSHGPC
jgi:hypothetical protein